MYYLIITKHQSISRTDKVSEMVMFSKDRLTGHCMEVFFYAMQEEQFVEYVSKSKFIHYTPVYNSDIVNFTILDDLSDRLFDKSLSPETYHELLNLHTFIRKSKKFTNPIEGYYSLTFLSTNFE